MESADIVGVVQDVSNKYTRGIMHKKILQLLRMTRVGVPSILIMNKIDQMKKKRDLLPLVRVLTSEKGWPNFSDIFMVSALTADGLDDLRVRMNNFTEFLFTNISQLYQFEKIILLAFCNNENDISEINVAFQFLSTKLFC